jgi:predicted DsbA family dithiol-disulfide isomerase
MENKRILIEMYYTLTCPNCKILEKMLREVLPQYGDKFELKKVMANSPIGMIETMKRGIHAVPTLLIDKKIVFRSVPSKEQLIETLNKY